MKTSDHQARMQAMRLVQKAELTRRVRNNHVRMVAGWPDPASVPADERAEGVWRRESAQAQIARWDAEIAALERELATVPRHLREQSLGFRLGARLALRVFSTPRGSRLLLRLTKSLLWMIRISSRRQRRR